MGDGLVKASAFCKGHAQVGVGVGVVGIEFQGLTVMLDRLADLFASR